MIKAIFAMDAAGGIGLENQLPWPNNSRDMEHFRTLTHDQVVVMGRNTWDSLPDNYKPLPNRINAVVSSTPIRMKNYFVTNIHSNRINDEIQKLAETFYYKDVYIIGGKQLIMSTLDFIEMMYVTQMQGEYETDCKLDKRKLFENFRLTSATPIIDHCTFEVYKHASISK